MIVIQQDAVIAEHLSPTVAAALFYVDGTFSTSSTAGESAVRSRCPHAHLTPTTVHGSKWGRICDTEPGNIPIEGALLWLGDQRRTDPLKIGADAYGLYADGSDWDKMGHTEGVRYIANPDGDPRVPPTFHAKQYAWNVLGGVDLTACLPGYFPLAPLPPKDPYDYSRYPLGPFRVTAGLTLNERATVEEYDKRLVGNVHGQNTARIAVLRAHIKLLRDRVWAEAHTPSATHPSWDLFWRGWRWQKLNDRIHGAVRVDA